MYTILSFDVEDVYFPSKYCIDDIPGWLAEIMTGYKLRGTFHVMGEKARLLKKNDELFEKQLQALDNFLRERVEQGFEDERILL